MTDPNPLPSTTDAHQILDRRTAAAIVDPPRTFAAIIRQIGPGLIIAANIVGSGELIMSTKTGAEAGIVLLWLILLGCVVKVFVQLELGRFTISHGETTLSSLNRVPGPSVAGVNWVVMFWAFMMFTTVAQLGGIVGGVGQALALTLPITGDMQTAVSVPPEADICALADWQLLKQGLAAVNDSPLPHPVDGDPELIARTERRMAWVERDLNDRGELGIQLLNLAREGKALTTADGEPLIPTHTMDDRIWVTLIGILTSCLLYVGRYWLIERLSVGLVVSFSLITMGNVIALQMTGDYALSLDTIMSGLSFQLPSGEKGIATALATFGIIGVGATELVSYPYWCLEKGYARSAGPREQTDAWLLRAKGWFRVMKFDAFASMVIYTIATAAFYLMGVAVLHSDGRNPEGMRMVSTLAQSYVPIFGAYARWLFLAGAIAVLYSTYLVANASNARMVADFLGVIGLTSRDPESETSRRTVRLLSAGLPLACVAVFILFPSPVHLVAIAGFTQCVMLPILGLCSLYFRYRVTDQRLMSGRLWDLLLLISCLALLIAGTYGAVTAFGKIFS
ncbi:MAG: Nramp family divalent metal transporter [Planctomycetaceae bacterium]